MSMFSRGFGFRCGDLCALLVVCLLNAGVSRAAPPTAAEAEYEQALASYKAGNLDAALAGLERAYGLEPKALYVYNMGRVLEGLGRLAPAYETYLRTAATPGVTAEMSALAVGKADGLRLVKDKAVVRFSLPPGSTAQIEAEVVTDLTAEVAIEPGRHLICAVSPSGAKIACLSRRLAAGVRVAWPPPATASQPFKLQTDLPGQLASVRIGDVAVLGDWKRVKEVELDVGATTLSLRLRDGRVITQPLEASGNEDLRVSVLAGGGVSPDSGRQPVIGPVPGDPIVEDVGAAGPGPWPWAVVGTGGAVLAAGIGLTVYANLSASGAKDATQAEAAKTWEGAQTLEVVGWSLMGVGAAALAGGLVWYFVAPDSDSTAVWIDVRVAPGQALLSLESRF